MCAALLWMAYAFSRPGALLAGVLAVLRWGTLSYWVNGHWGGTVTAAAGALVLGAYLRIRRRSGIPLGLTLGFGVVWLLYTRPLEGGAFALPIAAALAWHYFRTREWSGLARVAVPAAMLIALGFAGLGIYCRAITGSPLVMPYRLNRPCMAGPHLALGETAPACLPPRQHAALPSGNAACKPIRPGQCRRSSTAASSGTVWRFFLGPALYPPVGFVGANGGGTGVSACPWRVWPRRWRWARSSWRIHTISPPGRVFSCAVVQGIRHLR